MAQPYVGEIRFFAGTFAPVDWHLCDGSLLPISQYEVLYNLIGTTYGGDGVNTFALPNMQGRIPVHQGTDTSGTFWSLGQMAGTESVTLTTGQMPQHHHIVNGSSNGGSNNPANSTYGNGQAIYTAANPSVQMSSHTVGNAGGSLPHENRMPFQAVTFIIALFGVYPTQS